MALPLFYCFCRRLNCSVLLSVPHFAVRLTVDRSLLFRSLAQELPER